MSLTLIKTIFEKLSDGQDWSAHLMKYHHSKRHGTKYNCRLIELEPQGRLDSLIQDISISYTKEGKNRLLKYTDVRNYDGTCNGTTIYKIPCENSNVTIDLDELFEGIANTDTECDPFDMTPKAYILCGQLSIDGKERQIKLISMNSPITILKNKFCRKNNRFWDVPEKVLNLRTSINVIIYDRDVYMLDMSGETLFNMERAYKHRCIEAVDNIERIGIVSDIDNFRNIATTGHNPRRFTAFSKEKLDLLEVKANRTKVNERFGIPLTGDEIFDTTEKVNADKLVKVLCNKAMWDILEDTPVEVDGSKSWMR